ncbi:hypothetical protein V6N13_088590 [Hibiscus sabdariffa]
MVVSWLSESTLMSPPQHIFSRLVRLRRCISKIGNALRGATPMPTELVIHLISEVFLRVRYLEMWKTFRRSGMAATILYASTDGKLHLKPSPLEQPISLLSDQAGCEIADNWSLDNFASTTRAVDKAAPGKADPNDPEDYIKPLEKQKADQNDAARKEKQKTG